MKKLINVIYIFLFVIQANAAEISIDNSDIPIDKKCCNPFFAPVESAKHAFGCVVAADAGSWSPPIWGLEDLSKTAARWSPAVIGVRVNSAGNIVVRFVMQQSDINFYKRTFNDLNQSMGNTRVPYALEFDVIDHSDSLGEKSVNDFSVIQENLSEDNVDIVTDVSDSDSIKSIGVIIFDPEKLKADKLYQVIIKPTHTGDNGFISINTQVTVNYKWMAAMANGVSQKCDILDYIKDFYSGGGFNSATAITGDFGRKIPKEALHPWYYYAASKNDMSGQTSFQLGKDNNPAVCWNDYLNTAHDKSGIQYCHYLWSISVGGSATEKCIVNGCDGNYIGKIEDITMDQAFDIAESRYGSKIGTRSTGTHCWSDPGDNPTCIGGVWIRDYTGGIYGDGTSAIIYNPDKRKAYLITEGFWGYYKLFDGYKRLGPPTGDVETLDDGIIRQKFENGYLIWSPKGGLSYPAWGITQYDNNHEVVYPNGGGSGSSTQPTPDDPPVPGLPDFITDKVTLANQSGSKEKYTWKINETAYVHSWTDNIGDANWQGSADKIKVPFYLSKGSKEDDHSEWVRIDRQQISKDNLKINKQPKHEYIKFDLKDWADDSTVLPGRNYNFVVCADRPKDQDNGDGDVKEKHKSNNCSTEAVFYVDYGPPRNVDLTASNLALTGGRSQLQAGEKYGLQVEIANIGTEQPWNGFSSSYEIKGPSTGGVWQRIGEDTSRASSLYPNAIHFESMSSEQEVAAPMVGGNYVFRACADYTQAVPETDESNNCTDELPVYVAPPPMPDLITEGLQLTHGRTSLVAGELYGLTVAIRNIGDAVPSSNIRSSYQIKGPGTGGAWQFVADDGSDADQLYPGASQWEDITDEHGAHIPAVPGTYTARACADYQGNAAESDETNNCSEMTFEVNPVPAGSPRIVITNPNSDDDWRSSETDHDFRWDYFDFPTPGHVRIEYSLDGGATWLLVDDETTNDGRKYWEDMCDYHTVDTHHAFVRITSVEYPYVYDISDEFSIDHAAECE